MHSNLPRRRCLQAGLVLGSAFWLPAARACEYYTANLRVTHPWTRASQAGATSAVVCMKFDEVRRADRLVLVESPIASGAEMGGVGGIGVPAHRAAAISGVDFFVPEGQETHLLENGTFVRLTGLKFPLEAGRSYPLRLGFELGGAFDATLTVDYTRFT